ncbi:MAG: acyltransferase [Bacteroidota bacterium]
MENTFHKPHQDRIFGLDILRFCAIVFVVAAHGRSMAQDTILFEFPYLIFNDGVNLFFALSGFLIGGILLKQTNVLNEFSASNLLSFWKRRWLRTLPNYYLILLVNIVLVKFHLVQADFNGFNWRFFLFLHNFSSGFNDFFLESWSLSIEEWFYIFAPLLLFGFIKIWPVKKAFLITVLILIIAPVFFRLLKYDPDGFHWFQTDSEVRKVVVMRLDAIGYGLLAAWLAFYYGDFWKKCRFWFLGLSILSHLLIDYLNASGNILYLQVLEFSLLAATSVLYLPLADSIKTATGIIPKFITYISKISYSMYLVNLGIVSSVMRQHFPVKDTTDGVIKYILYWCIVIGLSGILYRFFEKPVMNLRSKIR